MISPPRPMKSPSLSSSYESIESDIEDYSDLEQPPSGLDAAVEDHSERKIPLDLPATEHPFVSPSLRSWETRIWENSLVQTVQKRVRKVFVQDGSPPVATRTRTSLKRSSSSANLGADDRATDGYVGDTDRTVVSLRKVMAKRKTELEPCPKRRPVDRED